MRSKNNDNDNRNSGKDSFPLVLKVDNDVMNLSMGNLSALENNVLHALLFYAQEKGSGEIVIPISNFAKLAGLDTKKGGKEYVKSVIENATDKFGRLEIRLRKENEYVRMVPFPYVKLDYERGYMNWFVLPQFVPLINNLLRNYSKLQIDELISIRSSYSKNIYRKLSQYRSTGVWRVTSEDFREYLGVPENYAERDIARRILLPAIEDLSVYFKDLSVEKTFKATGKGRPSVSGYIFSFIPQDVKGNDEDELNDFLAMKGGYEETLYICPDCGERLYRKYYMDQDTSEIRKMFCHPNFQEGCNSVFTIEQVREFDATQRLVQAEKE